MMEQNIFQLESKKVRKRTPFIVGGIIFALAAILGLNFYFFWFLPNVQAKEYIEKSRPLFDRIEKEVSSAKENTFLDVNTQFHARKDAMDDNLLDITELEKALTDIDLARKNLDELKAPKKVFTLHQSIRAYFAKAEQVLKLRLKEQHLYQKVINAYGDSLDPEVTKYIYMYYSGGEREPFISQTQLVVDYSEDALSRINNIEPPTEGDIFFYESRKENLEDIRATFIKLNENYRLAQYDLANTEVQGLTDRTELSNVKVKQGGEYYITTSDVAKGFQGLDPMAKDLRKMYQEIERK